MTRSGAQRGAGEPAGVVDFTVTGRRLRRLVAVAVVGVLVAWPVVAAVRDVSMTAGLLGELAGWATLGVVMCEIVIVGGSALAGLLRAGDRGDRLAGDDVALVPPQLLRRITRRGRAEPAD